LVTPEKKAEAKPQLNPLSSAANYDYVEALKRMQQSQQPVHNRYSQYGNWQSGLLNTQSSILTVSNISQPAQYVSANTLNLKQS